MIYLCFPNNPTGSTAITKDDSSRHGLIMQIKHGAVIIYDAAYEAYISEEDVPHSVSLSARAQEPVRSRLRSFSKNAGFTGVRLERNSHSERSQVQEM